jgi:hypothetical protein
MQRTEYGVSAATDGWFAVNLRDAAWVNSDDFGGACIFEGDAAPFAQVGYTLAVLAPGQPNGMYHREDDQEDFLVLSGECIRSALELPVLTGWMCCVEYMDALRPAS